MPIVSNTFQPAAWIDGATPAIDASELLAMSNAIKASQGIGACDTAAAVAAKTVAVSGFILLAGATVCAKFSLGNTAAAATLNVNGTGAFGIRCRGAEISARDIPTGYVGSFQFDGSYWQLLNPAVQVLSGTATLAVANWTGGSAPYVYNIAVAGMTDSDSPGVGVAYSSDESSNSVFDKAWQAAKPRIESAAGQLKIIARGTKPTVAIPIFYMGVQ